MNIHDIEKIINEHTEMIAVSAISIQNAKELSGKFLMVQALLTAFLKDFEDDKSKLATLRDVNFAMAIRSAEGKTITEKKVNVNLDKTYTDSREIFEKVDHIRDYIKTHMKIFENAHLMYRQYGRE